MKPSFYNFIWSTDSPRKVMIFNSRTTALAEVEKTYIDLLNVPSFDYNILSPGERLFVDRLKVGGFVLDDEADELKILSLDYHIKKYDRTQLNLTIAPTLRCNFSCIYCYEQPGENQNRRDGQNAMMPDNIQEEILNFFDREIKTVRTASVCWFGGETLLGKKIIFDLSQKLIAISEKNNIDYYSSMITNGYLLMEDPDMVQKLKDSRISFLQITLDGPPEIHNRRRLLKGDKGPTFDRILEGVKLLAANEMNVSVRINIDRSNMYGAFKLLDILEANNLKEVSVYLGPVAANTEGCNFFQNSCITMEEFSMLNQTFVEVLRQRGFTKGQEPKYPGISYGCISNRTNTYVIDPDGDIYKCWTEIGDKNSSSGNIIDFNHYGINEQTRHIQWLTWEPFEYPECLACKVLPICMGGCSYKALNSKENKPDCMEWKYNLEHYIRVRYKQEKELKEADSLCLSG